MMTVVVMTIDVDDDDDDDTVHRAVQCSPMVERMYQLIVPMK